MTEQTVAKDVVKNASASYLLDHKVMVQLAEAKRLVETAISVHQGATVATPQTTQEKKTGEP